VILPFDFSHGDLPLAFDSSLLDKLMDFANLDILLVTSKHNVQYLLGGHRCSFFGCMDAIGVSRYLPIFVYPKGRPDQAMYVGNEMEAYQEEVEPLRVPVAALNAWGTVDAIRLAVSHIRERALSARRLGIEAAFLPSDAYLALRAALPDTELVDALLVLERLRARKTPEELLILREASAKVVDAMLAVVASHGVGTTKRCLADALRREEVARGLTFEYCLIAMGQNLNREPSEQVWREGEVLSLDSGGNLHGYIGDLARMAILGNPDSELCDLLACVDEIQQMARGQIRPGARGGEIYAAVEPLMHRLGRRLDMRFVAHGMGLIAHEAPRLTANGPVPYSADDANEPLQPGMVLSIETTLLHPRRGFIKLEDTVAVAAAGSEGFGDWGRGWNRAMETTQSSSEANPSGAGEDRTAGDDRQTGPRDQATL